MTAQQLLPDFQIFSLTSHYKTLLVVTALISWEPKLGDSFIKIQSVFLFCFMCHILLVRSLYALRTKAGAGGNAEIYSLAFSHYLDAFCLPAFISTATGAGHTGQVCQGFNRSGITKQIVSSLNFHREQTSPWKLALLSSMHTAAIGWSVCMNLHDLFARFDSGAS